MRLGDGEPKAVWYEPAKAPEGTPKAGVEGVAGGRGTAAPEPAPSAAGGGPAPEPELSHEDHLRLGELQDRLGDEGLTIENLGIHSDEEARRFFSQFDTVDDAIAELGAARRTGRSTIRAVHGPRGSGGRPRNRARRAQGRKGQWRRSRARSSAPRSLDGCSRGIGGPRRKPRSAAARRGLSRTPHHPRERGRRGPRMAARQATWRPTSTSTTPTTACGSSARAAGSTCPARRPTPPICTRAIATTTCSRSPSAWASLDGPEFARELERIKSELANGDFKFREAPDGWTPRTPRPPRPRTSDAQANQVSSPSTYRRRRSPGRSR